MRRRICNGFFLIESMVTCILCSFIVILFVQFYTQVSAQYQKAIHRLKLLSVAINSAEQAYAYGSLAHNVDGYLLNYEVIDMNKHFKLSQLQKPQRYKFVFAKVYTDQNKNESCILPVGFITEQAYA